MAIKVKKDKMVITDFQHYWKSKTDKGHDSFLLDVPDFLNAVKNFFINKKIRMLNFLIL